MADQRQHFQHGVEPSDVSSTSDVDVYITRQRTFARQPAIQKTHAGNLERVEEEPSLMADSSTDQKNRGIFCNNFSEQSYLAYDGPFKKPAQQAYYHRYPISVPYYENRYPCNNAMCREPHFCYEHQTNRDCYNPAMPMPPSPQHYFPHDCHRGGYVRQFRRSSPSFMNLNHANIKLPDQELPRPKPEWPQGYRPGNQGPSPSTPAQHLAALSSKDNTSIPPSTATSLRSISLDQFMPSNFSSPRQSARLTRKRAMSSSPLSIDSIDINSLIRTSPDSLIAYINAPRLSSAGSYGHLSANGVSPSPKPQRSPSMRSPFFGLWQSTPSVSRAKSDEGCEESKDVPMIKKELPENEMKKEVKDEKMIVDSNNNNIDEVKLSSVNSPSESDKRESDMENEETIEPEKDENNNECLCQWKDCNLLFQSQDELVKHVNTDHIKKERRDFTCYWIDCQREQKPFKAQYMLVVHMRRHTGEKPNKCTFPGCNKAYSRLENLKTHERSHTGERPYVCEYENCSKAFTNASDRAKHQNRTHSSVKPYVCTVPGCTKRYTDPSSLRKHKKTCHPEHFAGAKKPKIDKAKGKPDTGKDSQTKTSVSDSRGNVSQGPGSSHRAHGSGNPSSPRESEVRDQLKESSQGQQHGKAQQVDFSPQSFTGDLTSSSSCVDSPQSNNILCDTTDQGDESSHVKPSGHTPKDNNLPRSPQDVAGQPFSGRPVDIATPGGNVLVENPVIPNQLSLPTINKHSEVGKWIADVSQRMKNASKYSNEMKENLPIDFSSRRSSESGVSSYISSRRSSEVSTHHNRPPHSMVPPVTEEITTDEFPPNKEARDAYYLQQPPQFKHWNNNNKPRRNDFYDEMVRPSPVPDAFDSAQRRSSSGYGSHHNLTVIRSPVFHKVPIQNSPEPVSAANRRMSDSIICEADSSNRYFPLRNSNNIVPRRSSEPATKFYSYDSSEFNTSSLASRQPGNQTPMERQENHLSLPDIYQSHPRDCGLINTQLASLRPQPLESGQKLTHYPYSVEASNKTNFYPHPPNCTQRIRGPPEATNHPRKGLWEYEQHINQQLAPVSDRQHDGHMSNTDRSYEVMVNDMGNLNTSEIVNEAVFPGAPSNMVVNDMNTLLSSLIEEERYFEKRQGNENTSSAALSHLF